MYVLKKVQLKDVNPSTWNHIDSLAIENYPWDSNGYKPETKVQLFYTENDIMVKFTSCESKVRVEIDQINGPVYQDSCVEFFFMPNKEEDESYFNIEVNAAGVYILQVGEINTERELIYNIPDTLLNIKTSINKKNYMEYDNYKPWTVEYKIPFSFIRDYIKGFEPKSGHKILGNFYKCGSKTEYNHYGCWKYIKYHKPSFHRPECFGEIILE